MKFNLHTKMEWMELIRKDLSDKNQQAPSFESKQSFNGNPFVHYDDLNFELSRRSNIWQNFQRNFK